MSVEWAFKALGAVTSYLILELVAEAAKQGSGGAEAGTRTLRSARGGSSQAHSVEHKLSEKREGRLGLKKNLRK